MKLVSLKIENFRCYLEKTSIQFDDLSVVVGKNDTGKSTLFDALAIFFDEAKLDSDDASVLGDKKNVRITCEFDDYPDELVIDKDHPTKLEEEYLLNENGRLEITKTYDGSLVTPKITRIFARAFHPSTPNSSDLLSLSNSDLKQRLHELEIQSDEIDLWVNTSIRRHIWASFDNLELSTQEISLEDEAGKKIWTQLKTYLPCYALFKSDRASTDQDTEAQDPMKAAVKAAIKNKEEELNTIADYVHAEVLRVAETTVKKLNEMDPALAQELKPNFKKPVWDGVFKISLTGDEEIPINKRGSGIRRLILLNFFRAKAEQAATEKNASSVIYAVEEPETSQHPNNQKMLMRAFAELAELPNCQVIISTHTPVVARLAPLKSLSFVEHSEDAQRIISQCDEATYERISGTLGVLPDHDVELFIGVEGGNDINFLASMSSMLLSHGIEVPNIEDLENCGKIIFFPLGGSNLALWKSRLASLNRPEMYIFDRDNEPPAPPKYQDTANEISKRDGCHVFTTAKREMEKHIHPASIQAVNPVVEIEITDFCDVPELVARAVHMASESDIAWDDLTAKKMKKKASGAKAWLNKAAIEAMNPELLSESDPAGEVIGWLNKISEIMS